VAGRQRFTAVCVLFACQRTSVIVWLWCMSGLPASGATRIASTGKGGVQALAAAGGGAVPKESQRQGAQKLPLLASRQQLSLHSVFARLIQHVRHARQPWLSDAGGSASAAWALHLLAASSGPSIQQQHRRGRAQQRAAGSRRQQQRRSGSGGGGRQRGAATHISARRSRCV
jgi:hypothetical protein